MVRIIFLLVVLSLAWAQYAPDRVLIKMAVNPTLKTQSVETTFSPKLKNLLANQGLASTTKIFPSESRSGGMLQAIDNPLDRYYLVTYPNTINVELLIEMLDAEESVELAQPVFIYTTMETYPDDLSNYTGKQDQFLEQINAPLGWDAATGNNKINVAVLDTGLSHSVLNNRVLPGAGFNFVNNNLNYQDGHGHGTAVAGIVAALDWNARLIPVKVLDDSGVGDSVTIAVGIRYAADNNAHVINLSLGTSDDFTDSFLQEVCDYAYNKGVVLVAAMGNYPDIPDRYAIVYPAAFTSVISVGSVTSKNNLSSFSVYGQGKYTAELVAPGENMWSANINIGYSNRGNGTSYATPLVSALSSLLKGQNPSLTNQDIRMILHNSADDLGRSGYDEVYGYGLINVYKALGRITTGVYLGKNLSEVLTFPNPARDKLKFSFRSDKTVGQVEIVIYDQRGRKITELDYAGGMAGVYITPDWDFRVNGTYLANGSYIYVIKVTTTDGDTRYGRNILSIVR